MIQPSYCPLCGAHSLEWGEGPTNPEQAVKEAQEAFYWLELEERQRWRHNAPTKLLDELITALGDTRAGAGHTVIFTTTAYAKVVQLAYACLHGGKEEGWGI